MAASPSTRRRSSDTPSGWRISSPDPSAGHPAPVCSGHSQHAHKSQPAYWADVPKFVAARAADCVLVDDRLDYLEAAASVGIVALLLDRKGAHRPESMPSYVTATLRNLAGLPHWVETWTSSHPS